MPHKFIAPIILVSLLLLYWMISLHNLTIVPRVYEDEPWQASTGWKLATVGVFGSDLFAGYYRMEDRYYGYMPLHPLLLAGVFRFAGLGLFQDRFEPVALGLLTLALTYSLARRLFKDSRIGLLAMLMLLSVRSTGQTPYQTSGILFLDMARIARYDMVVPVFGLSSLHAYLSARKRGRARWYFFAGLLAGLAGLAHLYGVLWLPVLGLLAFGDRPTSLSIGRRSSIGYMLLGFAVPWLPYTAYVLGDVYDWRGQTRGYADRFDLLNLRWYLENLLQEPRRYGPGLGSIGPALFLRAGFWSAAAALPLSLIALARRAWRLADRAAWAIVVPAAVLPILFALLIHLKLVNYLVTIIPVWAIAIAWGGVAAWARLTHTRQFRWARWAMAVVSIAILVEGATRIATLEVAASTTTPYYTYIDRIRSYLPSGARVLGLHNYWFGLEGFDYRSFAVPVLWMEAASELHQLADGGGLSLDAGLERVSPDIVLIDPRMREYFASDLESAARWVEWLTRHDGGLIGRVDDSTYGSMEIYRVNR